MNLPFKLETWFERRIARDKEWLEGIVWGKPRKGHPEGKVFLHIKQVLDNINKLKVEKDVMEKLRIIALIHDSFKYKVDVSKPTIGENNHSVLARKFAEKHLKDESILKVIELHDEAYKIWSKAGKENEWNKAEVEAKKLMKRISEDIDLYLLFFKCDSETGDKSKEPFEWFKNLVNESS